MTCSNEIPEWFLLDLPPVNLYTANLLMPYYNGVEKMRVEGIVQPKDVERTENVLQTVKDLVESHSGRTKCIKMCKLDKLTQCCTGCGRSIEEIIETGKRRNIND